MVDRNVTQREAKLREHWNDLAETAGEVLAVLRELSRYMPRASPVVVEFSVAFDERDFLDGLDNDRARQLLSHLQSRFPELRRLTRWTGLKLSDITPGLLEYIALQIERRQFDGACPVCAGWRNEK